MIEFVFASTSLLADVAAWMAVILPVWLVVGLAVALPLCRRLARVSEQYPPADEEEPS